MGVLDIQRILRSPLRAQSLALFCLAYGAISLLAVFKIKRVALFAMSLPGIDGRNRRAIRQRVVACRKNLQVLRIYAGAVSAYVIDDKPFRDVAISKEPCNAVCASVHSTKVECTVSVAVKRTGPHAAIALPRPFAVESLKFFHGAQGNMERMESAT